MLAFDIFDFSLFKDSLAALQQYRDTGRACKTERVPRMNVSAGNVLLNRTKDYLNMDMCDGHVQLDSAAQTSSASQLDSPFLSMSRSPFYSSTARLNNPSKPSLDEIDVMVSRILAKKKAKEAEAAAKKARLSVGGEVNYYKNGLAMTTAAADLAMKALNVVGSFVDGRK
jgi:hypothetical protein